ncbi:VWA domain-containing protein [Pseudaeromonas paramecii]|uniref:Tetratricopeptide repeat protein n=1 Tax=Pseudaeromonas paramecii TaxID=2138166 RepID=A0ABP8Q367_9GAMM
MSDLVLLRPWWLLALLPLGLLYWQRKRLLFRRQDLIRPSLLAYLSPEAASPQSRRRHRWPWLAALLALLALSGPAVQKNDALYEQEQSWYWLLDVSHSMLADDLPPSRLIRSRYKLLELLELAPTAKVGLIAFAGDAFVISPVTDDHDTLRHMLRELEPGVMPQAGSDPVAAVRLGLRQLTQSQTLRGRLLLITDNLTAAQAQAIRQLMANQPWPLDLLVVGTPPGAAIPLADGRLLRNAQGQLVIAKTDYIQLQQLADQVGGTLYRLDGDESQWARLLRPDAGQRRGAPVGRQQVDLGYWLLLPLIGLALMFRRGLLWLCLLTLLGPVLPRPAMADEGIALYQAQRYAEAAQHLDDPLWRGNAFYRAGNYQAALGAYGLLDGAQARFNSGNALVQLGRYQEALSAYDAALALDANHFDARFNRDLVANWLANQDQHSGEAPQPQDSSQQDTDPLKVVAEAPGNLMKNRLRLQATKRPSRLQEEPW